MNQLREIRQSLGLTQSKVAKSIDISERSLQNYEQGITEAPANVLVALADLFKVSVDYLLGRGGDPAIPKNYQEEVLLDNFRACDDAEQKFVLKAAELGATKRR